MVYKISNWSVHFRAPSAIVLVEAAKPADRHSDLPCANGDTACDSSLEIRFGPSVRLHFLAVFCTLRECVKHLYTCVQPVFNPFEFHQSAGAPTRGATVDRRASRERKSGIIWQLGSEKGVASRGGSCAPERNLQKRSELAIAIHRDR
jgi:hypothetical protein